MLDVKVPSNSVSISWASKAPINAVKAALSNVSMNVIGSSVSQSSDTSCTTTLLIHSTDSGIVTVL